MAKPAKHPPHKTKCCDSKHFEAALKSLNSLLPGARSTTEGANRYLNPTKEALVAPYRKKGKTPPDNIARKATLFDLEESAKGNTPVLDGLGNYLGMLDAPAVAINWGQIKTMPELAHDGTTWKRVLHNKPVQYVYAFSTSMHVDPALMQASPYDRMLTKHPPISARPVGVSGWIPKSAISGHNKGRIGELFDCSKQCISRIAKHRERKGETRLYRFVDLDETKWSKTEWQKAGSGKDIATAEEKKHLDDTDKSAKLTISEVMTRETIEADLLLPAQKKKYAASLETFFPRAIIAKGKKKGDANDMSLGDYLARNLATPAALRYVYLLWALPGSGGVAMDTIPIGATFHRLVAHTLKTNIYRVGKTRSYATGKKITWFYGFVEYPAGDNKTAKRYGWVLSNAVARVAKK